jgi:hypothetical protein
MQENRNKETNTNNARVLGLGFKGRQGTGENLGPEAGLLGDSGEDGPNVGLRLLDRLVRELARHRAHLVGSDLGRRGHGAGRLVLGRRLRRHHEVAARVRRHRARARMASPPVCRSARLGVEEERPSLKWTAGVRS